VSGLDERAKPNPDQMKTGLLKKEKGSHPKRARPKVEKVKPEKKVKTEKVKSGRVTKKTRTKSETATPPTAGDSLTKLGRSRKSKKTEERKFELSTSPATDLDEAPEEAIEEAEPEEEDSGMALVAAYNTQHEDSDGDDYAEQLALDEDEQMMVGMGHEEQVVGDEFEMTFEQMSDDVQAGLDEDHHSHESRQSSYFEEAFEEIDTVMG
jgi:hypothetical protein